MSYLSKTLYLDRILALSGMAGRSGYPNISGRVFRAFKISGFENWNPKFADKNQNPTFRVPEISGSGSGKPEPPELPTRSPRAAWSRGSLPHPTPAPAGAAPWPGAGEEAAAPRPPARRRSPERGAGGERRWRWRWRRPLGDGGAGAEPRG